MVSGLPTDRWVFEGFLPRKGPERRARLSAVAAESRTVVLYEAPHRLVLTLTDLCRACGGERRVAMIRELTKLHEQIWRGTLTEAVALDTEPRGEYVLVVDGAPVITAAISEEDIEAALERELSTGGDRREAVGAVAAVLGVPKRRVYDAAVRLRRNGDVVP